MAGIHDGHRERVKNRFFNEGLDNFQPHEVLELLLFFAMPYKDTNGLAHALLDKFGSLSAVFEADTQALTEVSGIGPNAAALIKLIPELARVYQRDKWTEKVTLNSTAVAAQYLIDLYRGRVEEEFCVLCLNSQNRLIRAEFLNHGTVSETGINPRALADTVLRNKAVGIIIAHNHPGGNPTASMADMESTRKIINLFKPIGISVYDHIIISGSNYFSFLSRGLLSGERDK